MTLAEIAAELGDYLAPHLKPGIDPVDYAVELISSREVRADGYLYHEVPGRYTLNGNPLPVIIDLRGYIREQC